MHNDYLRTDIALENNNYQLHIGEIRKGKIIFTPNMNFFVISLGYELVLHINKKTNVIFQKSLIQNKKIVKGKTYQFDLEIKGRSPCTYEGKNINMWWELRSFINLRTDYYLKVRNAYLKKIGKSHFYDTPKDLLIESLTIFVDETELQYQVRNTEKELSTSSILSWSILIGVTGLSFLFLNQLKLENLLFIWLGSFIVMLFFTIIPYYYKTSIFESMNVNTSFLGNNQFAVVLGLSKNLRSIKKVKVSYYIEEWVKETYQDSEIIRTEIIYRSPIQEKSKISQNSDMILDFPDLAYDFVFEFPDNNIPTMLLPENLEIEWKVDIEVYFTLGLKSKFTKLIEVSRAVE